MSVPHKIGFDGVRVRHDSAEGYDELLVDIGGKPVQINEFATVSDDYVKPSSLMVVENNPELLSAAQKLDAKLAALATKVTKSSNE
jgi:hypothetical protein